MNRPADRRASGEGSVDARSAGTTPLRFGLVGTGSWANSTYGVALSLKANADFAGVWGRNPGKTRDFAAKFGVRAYRSFEALTKDVDAVAFAVPPDVQAELASRAATAGVHILLEKPAALRPQASLRLEQAVQASGVACLTFFTLRFDEHQRSWLDGIVAGGAWLGAWTLWLSSAMLPGGAASGSSWRAHKGALWDVGPHALSMVVPVLGPVDAVCGHSGERGLVHVVMTHRSGATSTMSLTLSAPELAGRVDLGFWGSRGTELMPVSSIPYSQTLGHALRELAALARDEKRLHPCDMRLSRHVVDALYAAETAIRRGGQVAVGG